MVMMLTFDVPSSNRAIRIGRRHSRDGWREPRTWRARRVAGDDGHMVSDRAGRSRGVSGRPRASPRPGDRIPNQSQAMGCGSGMGR